MPNPLSKRWSFALVPLAVVGTALFAQTTTPSASSFTRQTYAPPPYYGYGGYGYGWGGYPGAGSTPAGGYLAGMGQAVRAQGQYNLMTSEATVNLEEAAKRDIENRVRWTNAYFEMRRINQAYKDAQKGPKRTSEDWVRMAHDAAPERLASSALDAVTGRIAWPSALQGDAFGEERETLDTLFAERAEAHGAVGAENHGKIRTAVDSALAKLKDRIRDVDTRYYLEARNFLTGLAREADFPTG